MLGIDTPFSLTKSSKTTRFNPPFALFIHKHFFVLRIFI